MRFDLASHTTPWQKTNPQCGTGGQLFATRLPGCGNTTSSAAVMEELRRYSGLLPAVFARQAGTRSIGGDFDGFRGDEATRHGIYQRARDLPFSRSRLMVYAVSCPAPHVRWRRWHIRRWNSISWIRKARPRHSLAESRLADSTFFPSTVHDLNFISRTARRCDQCTLAVWREGDKRSGLFFPSHGSTLPAP